jgi:hypothetical protein
LRVVVTFHRRLRRGLGFEARGGEERGRKGHYKLELMEITIDSTIVN